MQEWGKLFIAIICALRLYISFNTYYVPGALLDFGVNCTVLVPATLGGLYILIK